MESIFDNVGFSSIIPKPKELLYLIGDKCLKNTNCKFEFDTDDNAKVKVLLQNV